jgi:two-component system CheB/CheR fusion protein
MALQTQVIPRLFEEKSVGESVRVWVPGCSTGEEAYSLAMLLRDYTATRSGEIKVQVFATDIDAVAIDTARAGVYPANIVADVPADYLTRYFVQEEGNYRVNKSIRDMVVFAEQDIILDPPFSHMDLISCRNLLIYLNADLQKKLLPLFHYALNPNGFLFLGSSETIGEFTDLFATVDRKNKFYQRKTAVNPSRLIPGLRPLHVSGAVGHGASGREIKSMEPISMRTLVEQQLLAHHTPSCVLINDAEEVLYVHGSTGSYLEPATGDANLNLLRMARPGLRLELATAVHKAITQKAPIRYDGVQVQVKEQVLTVNLLVSPVTSPSATGLYLVVFEDVDTVAHPPAETSTPMALTDTDQRIAILERELHLKDEYLQTNLGELTTSNEELQSTNEELQSINEEMDTSREELQSVNEELSTVNTELQKKIEELSQANDDMNNLLAGTDVGTVFIDRDLRIQRFTPAATAIVNLIPTDIGRPIAHLATNLVHYETLLQDARRVFETLAPKEVEVQSTDGRWYLMRILPYRTQENAIVGVVITFVNTTTLHTMQERLQASQLAEQAHAFAESIVATVHEPLLVLAADLRVVSVNDAFTDTFKVPKDETVGTMVYDLGNGQWNIPALRTLLEEVLPQRTAIYGYQVTHTFERIGPRVMRLNARELRQANGQQRMILLAIEDETKPVEGAS